MEDTNMQETLELLRAEVKRLEGLLSARRGKEPIINVRYSSNNSGGHWWLNDEDWLNLEKAGWEVKWFKTDPHYQEWHPGDDRFLDALAQEAVRRNTTMGEAIAEWSRITGQDPEEEGCPCCGQPHSFYRDWRSDNE